MIEEHVLQGVDFSFLFIVLIFASLTPKTSRYFNINWLIVAIFSVNIGVAEIQIALQAEKSLTSAFLSAFISLSFMVWFWPKTRKKLISGNISEYVSFLCGAMAAFYLYNHFYPLSDLYYIAVMICFQFLMLLVSGWGVVDGNHSWINRRVRSCITWFNHSFRSHG